MKIGVIFKSEGSEDKETHHRKVSMVVEALLDGLHLAGWPEEVAIHPHATDVISLAELNGHDPIVAERR